MEKAASPQSAATKEEAGKDKLQERQLQERQLQERQLRERQLRERQLREQVEEAIHEKLAYASRNVRCECEDGLVRLEGEVSSFYFKQLAQEALRTLNGVRQVVNNVSVVE